LSDLNISEVPDGFPKTLFLLLELADRRGQTRRVAPHEGLFVSFKTREVAAARRTTMTDCT
jgi:hypothetical protein